MSSPSAPQRRVLKAGAESGSVAQTTYNFIDLRQRCDAYVEKVRSEARQCVLDAQNEAAEIRESARKQGHADGMSAGMEEAAAKIEARSQQVAAEATQKALKTAMPAIHAAAEELKAARQAWNAEWEARAVSVALLIAEKLTHRMLTVDPALLRQRTAAILELAIGQQNVRLQMHPDDVKAIGPDAHRVLAEMTGGGTVRIEASNKVSRGGCVIHTQRGEIDGQVEAQIERISEELLGFLHPTPPAQP